jgi:hypothetical protein
MQNRGWRESPQAAAVYYASLGLEISPWSANRIPKCGKEWQFKATTNLEIIRAWWRIWPFADPGWSLPASIAVLDIDVKRGKNGYRDFERLVGIAADQFPAPSASTPSGGLHLFCSTDSKKWTTALSIGKTGIDVVARVHCVILPGANNGRLWIPNKPSKPAPIPAAIVALLKKQPNEASKPNERENPPSAPLGSPLTAFVGNATRMAAQRSRASAPTSATPPMDSSKPPSAGAASRSAG